MRTADQYLRINAAADYLGICPNTLRHWGRIGRIAERRDPNNYRLYRLTDLARLRQTVPRRSGTATIGSNR
jgi:DNA-binding transcriptional MerR regulator